MNLVNSGQFDVADIHPLPFDRKGILKIMVHGKFRWSPHPSPSVNPAGGGTRAGGGSSRSIGRTPVAGRVKRNRRDDPGVGQQLHQANMQSPFKRHHHAPCCFVFESFFFSRRVVQTSAPRTRDPLEPLRADPPLHPSHLWRRTLRLRMQWFAFTWNVT